MQQLHLVGVTTDHDSLIFSVRKGAKSGSFVLPLDESLLAAVADAVRRMHAGGADVELPIELDTAAAPQRRQSNLSPREIQDRLRGGRTLEEVATEAGVGEEWVARFAAPVEAERNQIVSRSRGLVYAKSRLGNSRETLGMSVRWNLADRGVRMTDDDFDSAWSGYLLNDSTWMVTFSFVSRKREQKAEWEVDLDSDTLTSRNRLASDLGYVEPGRRRRSLTSLQPPAAARAERPAVEAVASKVNAGARAPRAGLPAGTTGSRSPLTSGSRAKADSADPAGKSKGRKSVGRKSAATRPAGGATTPTGTKKAPAKKVSAGKAPAKKVSARKISAGKAPAKKVSAGKVSAGKAPAKNAPAKNLLAKRAPAKKVSAGKVSARKVSAGKVSAKKAPAERAPAKKAPAQRAPSKAPAKGSTAASRSGREVPPAVAGPAPAATAGTPAAGPSAAKPAPNELGLRRLQMIGGANGGGAPMPGSLPGGGYAARAAATSPAPRRDDWPPEPPRPAPRPQAPPADAPAPANADAGHRDVDVSPGRTGPSGVFDEGADPDLDVTPAKPGSSRQDAASEAEARRLERRRARAAAREPDSASRTATTERSGTAGSGPGAGDLDIGDSSDDVDDWQAFAAAAAGGRSGRRSGTRAGAGAGDQADGDGDGRVVTIRATRTTPPGNEGEIILPPDRPPLRPAQPAAQPKRRRFGRNGR